MRILNGGHAVNATVDTLGIPTGGLPDYDPHTLPTVQAAFDAQSGRRLDPDDQSTSELLIDHRPRFTGIDLPEES